MINQLVVNQKVLDDGDCCAYANPPSSLPCTNDDMMFHSNSRISRACPNHGFAAPRPIIISNPNYGGQPAFLSGPQTLDAPSRSTSYAYHDSTQVQYTPQSVSEYMPLSNRGSWHNPPTLKNYSAQNDPMLGGTCTPAMGNNHCWPSHAFTMKYPDELSNQWQTSAIPQTGPLTTPVPSMTPPLLAAESLQFSFSSQTSHDRTKCYPSSHPPIANHPYSVPRRSHPSPLRLSCRWLCDNVLCEFTGTLEELKAHCKSSHFPGRHNAQFQCCWEACAYHKRGRPTEHDMRRDCMWRHTREVHLRMKRGT